MCNQQHRHGPVLSQPIAAGVALAAMIVVCSLANQTDAASLDNCWTTGGYAENKGSQSVRSSALTNLGSLRGENSEKGSPPPAQILFSAPAGSFLAGQGGSNHDPCPVPIVPSPTPVVCPIPIPVSRPREGAGSTTLWVNYLLKECVPTHRPISFHLPRSSLSQSRRPTPGVRRSPLAGPQGAPVSPWPAVWSRRTSTVSDAGPTLHPTTRNSMRGARVSRAQKQVEKLFAESRSQPADDPLAPKTQRPAGPQ